MPRRAPPARSTTRRWIAKSPSVPFSGEHPFAALERASAQPTPDHKPGRAQAMDQNCGSEFCCLTHGVLRSGEVSEVWEVWEVWEVSEVSEVSCAAGASAVRAPHFG